MQAKPKKCKLRTASAHWKKQNNLEHLECVWIFKYMGTWYAIDEFERNSQGYSLMLSAFAGIDLREIDVNGEYVIVRYSHV